MAVPLIVLAIGSVVAGYLGVPAALGGSNLLEHFLEPSLAVQAAEGHAGGEGGGHATELALMLVSSLVAVAGIACAAFVYLKRPQLPDSLVGRYPALYQFLLRKGYVDEVYDTALVQPIAALSEHVLWKGDARVIDGAVNGAGTIVAEGGSAVRLIQTGSMRAYAVSVLLGVVAIFGYYLWM